MIDKQKLKKIVGVLGLILIIIILLIFMQIAISRYQREIELVSDAEAAFWMVRDSIQEKEIIRAIEPTKTDDSFTFSIYNGESDYLTQVPLKYQIKMITTTNLPLEYRLEMMTTGNECKKKETIYQDDDGTYYKEIIFEPAEGDDFELGFGTRESDYFKLIIYFPEPEEESLLYADLIESIRIQISAEQIIDE